jgi:hypothetical protein
MISFTEFKGYFFILEKDEPVFMFCQIAGYIKKGHKVMFQGKENGKYLYC